MVTGVERLGNYEVRPMGDGNCLVSTALPRHAGAGIWNEEAVEALRDKYDNPKGDEVVLNKPKMSETEANIRMILTPAFFRFFKSDAHDAFKYYANKEGTITNKVQNISTKSALIVLGALAGIGYIKYGNKIPGLLKQVPEVLKKVSEFFKVVK